MLSNKKTPDQIRRETVPAKHYGLTFGFLGTLLGFALWFGGWGVLHQEQVRHYPQYVTAAIRSNLHEFSPAGKRYGKRQRGMTDDQLRYALMRYGNENHRFDLEILRHGWYPKGADGEEWVASHGAIAPTYSSSPVLVFKWPLTLSLFTCLGALVWGLVEDHRYRSRLIAGVPFDGSVLATVSEYKRETKGDGMKYRVREWKDR